MTEAYNVVVAPHCPLGPIALDGVFAGGCDDAEHIYSRTKKIHYNEGSELLDYLADPCVFARLPTWYR